MPEVTAIYYFELLEKIDYVTKINDALRKDIEVLTQCMVSMKTDILSLNVQLNECVGGDWSEVANRISRQVNQTNKNLIESVAAKHVHRFKMDLCDKITSAKGGQE